MALKKTAEKEFAKILYINQNLSQKEIAERVGVTEKTIGKWIIKGGWDKLRRSLLTTKKQQIAMMYDQLEWQNKEIASRPIVRDIPASLLKPKTLKNALGDIELVYPEFDPEDFPIKVGNVATSKEADVIVKITSSIQKLENETSLGSIIEVAKDFIEFVREIDFEKSKDVTVLFDSFINSKMNKHA